MVLEGASYHWFWLIWLSESVEASVPPGGVPPAERSVPRVELLVFTSILVAGDCSDKGNKPFLVIGLHSFFACSPSNSVRSQRRCEFRQRRMAYVPS